MIAALKKHREESNKGVRWLIGGFFGAGLALTSLNCTHETSIKNPSDGAVVGFFGALTGLSAIGSGFAFWKSLKIDKKANYELDMLIAKDTTLAQHAYQNLLSDKSRECCSCSAVTNRIRAGDLFDSFLRIKKRGNNAFDDTITKDGKKHKGCSVQ